MSDSEKQLTALLTGGFFLFFMLIIVVMVVGMWGLMFKKAGYNFWLGLLMLLPEANFIMMIWFLVAKWPVQQEVERVRAMLRAGGSQAMAQSSRRCARISSESVA